MRFEILEKKMKNICIRGHIAGYWVCVCECVSVLEMKSRDFLLPCIKGTYSMSISSSKRRRRRRRREIQGGGCI